MADLSSSIETNAQKPKRIAVDRTQVEQLSIGEQIKQIKARRRPQAAERP